MATLLSATTSSLDLRSSSSRSLIDSACLLPPDPSSAAAAAALCFSFARFEILFSFLDRRLFLDLAPLSCPSRFLMVPTPHCE